MDEVKASTKLGFYMDGKHYDGTVIRRYIVTEIEGEEGRIRRVRKILYQTGVKVGRSSKPNL